MTIARLDLTRPQIVAHRRVVNRLDERLPHGPESFRLAAWAGLQDSMPRAALLSIHARVGRTQPSDWEDPSLAQFWGPRFSAYVAAARDLALFTLGRLPDDAARRRRAETTADALHGFLGGRRMAYGEAGRGLGVQHNSLRYGAPTGRIVMRWDGARQPIVWTVPPPAMAPAEARMELARRFLHVFGPSTPEGFGQWAGIRPPAGNTAFEALSAALVPVRTPIGDAWILAEDEAAFLAPPALPGAARLLPSGDAFWLFWGADRELLVPDAVHRAALWTTRVWPGGLLVGGELAGIWRRADANVTIEPWRRLSAGERDAVQAEAESLPLPGVEGRIRVAWVE